LTVNTGYCTISPADSARLPDFLRSAIEASCFSCPCSLLFQSSILEILGLVLYFLTPPKKRRFFLLNTDTQRRCSALQLCASRCAV